MVELCLSFEQFKRNIGIANVHGPELLIESFQNQTKKKGFFLTVVYKLLKKWIQRGELFPQDTIVQNQL